MKLQKFRDAQQSASRRVSDLCQTSSLGGIAAIWTLKVGTPTHQFTNLLIWSLVVFILALTINFFHYVWRVAAWGVMARCREKDLATKNGDQEVLDPPTWVNRVTLVFFVAKVASMLTGFILLFLQARILLW